MSGRGVDLRIDEACTTPDSSEPPSAYRKRMLLSSYKPAPIPRVIPSGGGALFGLFSAPPSGFSPLLIESTIYVNENIVRIGS